VTFGSPYLLVLLLNTLVTEQQCALGLGMLELGADASGASARRIADAASRF